ncbi:MAG: M48 family metalloprotease [Chloroflexi bacterium]|nr:M48 family metalloprotease [Chloroflexota bacterium]
MTQQAFDSLVKRLEGVVAEHPGAYKLRVFLLALLGYAYIFLVLALLLLAVGLLVAVVVWSTVGRVLAFKLGVPVLGLVALLARSLWVRLSPPEGVALSREEAGPLFQVVEDLQRALKAPKVHQILLTGDVNAAVVQHPRWGVFGWYTNYLLVGLPLMQALSPQQVRAVLAHELGHLSGAHSRLSGWIYRVRETWFQLVTALAQKRHWGSFIFLRFFAWYLPFFDAYSFVLRRAQEYEADRAAAALVGAREAAAALVNVHVYRAFLDERFWPTLLQQADDQADPPAPYPDLARAVRGGVPSDQAMAWIAQAVQVPTGTEDSHPSLADRLAALGQHARAPEPVAETAGQHFLGAALGALSARLDHAWQSTIASSWRERHEQVQAARQRLMELEEQAQRQPLDHDAAWQRAFLTLQFHGGDAALPLCQAVLQEHPDHAPALYAVGDILLAQGNAEGVAAIGRAMQLDGEAVLPGCERIYRFLIGQGREQEAQAYYRRAVQQAEVLEQARQERAALSVDDTYLPHDLPASEVARLREQLARLPEIARAYLVRKEVQYFPEKPLYVLGVVVGYSWRRWFGRKSGEQILQQIDDAVEFPGETLLIVTDDAPQRLKKALEQTSGAEVYRR